MNLDPRHLSQLSIIVETGSFQSAADRLNLTQPALSRNMRMLESRLGAAVFQREGRRSVPNSLGRRLARTGLAIRVAEEQAETIATQSARGSLGELRIGAPPVVAGRFLTGSVSAFVRRNPMCNVVMRTGLVSELRSMLERGEIDFMLGPQGMVAAEEALEFAPLIDDRVGMLCRVGHRLIKRKSLKAADFKSQAWLMHSKGSLLRQQTEAAMIAAGITPIHTAVETDSIRSALEIVANTDLITTMPRATTEPYLEERLVFLSFDSPHFQRPVGIISRRDTADNPLQAQFYSILVDSLNKPT